MSYAVYFFSSNRTDIKYALRDLITSQRKALYVKYLKNIKNHVNRAIQALFRSSVTPSFLYY